MDDLSNKFDKFFGVKAQGLPKSTKKENEGEAKMAHFISHKADNRSAKKNGVHLTWEQKDFCTHINQKEGAPFELIVFLRKDNAGVLVEEVRGMDFHLKREYKVYPKSRTFERIQGILPIHGNWRTMRGFSGSGYYVFTWRFAAPTATNLCPIEIDRHGYFAPFTEAQLVLAIRQSKIGSSSFSSDETSGLYDTLAKQLQKAGDEIFIYELLQNASDKPFGETVDVQIQLVPQRNDGGKVRGGFLKFSHTGSVFDFLDVAAICSANQKSKIDVNKIGYKGIGFKTVFRYNSRVEIRSGKFGFAFDEERTRNVRPELPWMTTPDTVQPNSKDDFRVDIRMFPRDKDLRLGNGEKSYQQLLLRLFNDERSLLFIPRLRQVKIIIPGMPDIISSPQATNWCRSRVFCESVGDDVRIAIKHELDATENSRIPEKYRNLQSTSVMFACGVEGRRLKAENVETSHLYCYLPATDAHWGLPFLMNTDMVPDGNRANIEYGVVEVNKFFSHVAGDKFCEWICDLIKAGKYEYDSVFSLIPDFAECVKGRIDAAPFIKAFQEGFEDRLSTIGFKLPDDSGELIDASEISIDDVGVLDAFETSLWQRFEGVGRPVHKSLRSCHSFNRFVETYKDVLGIRTFGWNELRSECSKERVASWLKNPNANSKFVAFLLKRGTLVRFTDVAIYLDNRGELGRSDEMYRYGDGVKNVERWLPKFAHLARYLSPKVTYHEKLCDVKFKGFGPRTFLKECVLSVAAIRDTCTALREIETAKGFWSFIAHYRMNDGKERFADDYELLGILPFVTESGEVVDSLVNKDFSVYARDEQSDAKILQYKWFDSHVRFISHQYFTGDEGPAIKDLLTSPLFADRKRLVGKVELRDVIGKVFAKFKGEILADMRATKSDMGVYAFLSDCVANNCINTACLRDQITSWPVESDGGELIERIGCKAWYYCDQIVDILRCRWMGDDGIVVLSRKYEGQKNLFSILGARDYESVGFGEFFREEISSHLNKDCSDADIIAFHEYMREQRAAGRIGSDRQIEALRQMPTIVVTKDGVCRQNGCEGALIVQDALNVPLEVTEGNLPESVKVLDPRLVSSEAMVEYWKLLGGQIFDSGKILEKSIEAYLERQQAVDSGTIRIDEFMPRHISFVLSMVQRNIDPDLLKGIKLIDGKGLLVSPKELVLADVYGASCAFQKYGCSLSYVSDCYLDKAKSEAIRTFLCKLGVRDEFCVKDVPLLQEREFCKYFWTEYSKGRVINDEIVKAMKENPCVLDRACANVRKPSEFYSLDLEHPYVESISGAEEKLPLCAGVNAEIYKRLSFSCALTAGDAIEFLLSDADGVRYGFRARALKWIAEGVLSSEDVDRYRNDNRALWRNAKNGQLTPVRDLCVIKSHDANRVRSHFGNSDLVCDLRDVDNGEPRISKEILERALARLGVVIVDNSALKPIPNGSEVDKDIKDQIKIRLLILLASSSEGNWHNDYKDRERILDACEFYVCDSFTELCTQFTQLKSERGTFAEQDGKVYYVGGWQDKRVYLDIIRFLKKKLELGQYTDDDLKDAFDTDGGFCGLARRVVDECGAILSDAEFRKQMVILCPLLAEEIEKELQMRAPTVDIGLDASLADVGTEPTTQAEFPIISGRGRDTNIESGKSGEDSGDDSKKEGGNLDSRESDGKTRSAGQVNPWEVNEVTDDERLQLENLFRNDRLSPEEMCDQNRLVTLRLYNYLRDNGYEPELSEREFNHNFNVHAKGGTDIKTKCGDIVHVISAFRGVAYISPYYWRGVSAGRCVICAVVGHMRDDFKKFKSETDLQAEMGDDLAVVRIAGEDRVHQVSRFFDVDKPVPMMRNVLPGSSFKIYALIRVKAKTSMDVAFDPGDFSWSDEMPDAEKMNMDKSDYWD